MSNRFTAAQRTLEFAKRKNVLLTRVLFSGKPSLVPEGREVEPLEASTGPMRIDPTRLRAYREVTGWPREEVPLTFPHVMASALHLDLLSSPRFPVRLLGLVHLSNRIEQLAPLDDDAEYRLTTKLSGMRRTERGQEFELHTELHAGSDVPWREVTVFLARAARTGPKPPKTVEPATRTPDSVVGLHAPAGLGRHYGRIAGDLNPIHLFDVTAKAFGFKQAIAHGMWSLARVASTFERTAPCTLDVQFKLPVFLPAKLVLERSGDDFALYDALREKPHLVGTFAHR